ncbi:MAG: S8 family serine peptidase [Clostridia bacterium]|nr:S8 family serine peptidase [Clostridia bacterium]
MNIKKFISILLSIIFMLSALPFCASAKTETESAEYVEGEIVITSSAEIVDSEGNLFTSSDDKTVYLDFDETGIEELTESETYSAGENRYLAEVDGNISEVCNELNKIGNITAEPNYILHTTDFVMPSEVTNNVNFYKNYQKWYLNDKMHFPEAWQEYEVTGAGVTVAIIDDGFYVNASDFPVNLWRNSQGTIGWNAHNNNDNIAPIYKSDGTAFDNTAHGSNVAGVIGMAPNGSGGIGAAYGAELMLIQAACYLSDTQNPSFTSASVANAIDYARQNGADIINLSLGSTSNSSAISSAITRAVNAGVLVIASAGNNGTSTSSQKFYPASLSNVLGVMAIDKDNPTQLAAFSNYDTNGGQFYNIAAPGVGILGCGVSTGKYTLNNGTSQAAPLVAAAAALYMEKYPDRTAEQLKADMLDSATETVTAYSSTSYTYKSLNVLTLLDSAKHKHSWSAWITVQQPTCILAGLEKRTCSECDEYETNTLPKLGHSYIDEVISPTCDTQGYTSHTCSRCGDTYTDTATSALGHSYSDWTVITYPSSDSDGLIQRECESCHDIQSRAIPNVLTNCDFNGNIISGFSLGTTDEDFISDNVLETDVEVTVTPSAGTTLGTGSQVTVTYLSGDAVSYYVVIYGDINGDGLYDGIDSMLDSCVVSGMLNEESLGTAAYTAGDCNHDGVIDSLDVQILEDAGLLLAQVNQSSDTLEASSAYSEYLNLISQTVEAETVTSTEDSAVNYFELIVSFIKDIVAIIRSAILFIR